MSQPWFISIYSLRNFRYLLIILSELDIVLL